MIVGLDIGNSSTLMGIYESGSTAPEKTFRFETNRKASADNLSSPVLKYMTKLYGPEVRPDGFVYSSVVRELNEKWNAVSENIFKTPAVQVSHICRLNIKITYDNPSTLGPDRITNAEAAFTEYGGGIIIDIGTALTICAVGNDGSFYGGIIAPGPGTGAKALSSGTSLLPEVSIEKPDKVTAESTEHSIKSGIYYGWSSMINGLTEKLRNENRIKAGTILTGGFSEIFYKDITHDIFDPILTMKGLKIIYDNNR